VPPATGFLPRSGTAVSLSADARAVFDVGMAVGPVFYFSHGYRRSRSATAEPVADRPKTPRRKVNHPQC
jgi:APA family basic amino acid/polyamine antiporter